jgi:hypothetical protein
LARGNGPVYPVIFRRNGAGIDFSRDLAFQGDLAEAKNGQQANGEAGFKEFHSVLHIAQLS